MDIYSLIASLGLFGIFSFIFKDLLKNFFCGLVIRFHPAINVGDWIKCGRWTPAMRVERIGVKYTYGVDEDGNEVIQENESIFTASWIKKGEPSDEEQD